jgi:feruloyl esterase
VTSSFSITSLSFGSKSDSKMVSSNYVYFLGLAQLLTPALSANVDAEKACTPERFASLGLSNIDVLSVDAKLERASWDPSDTLNAYPTITNKTVEVCQLTVNYTHPGWNDKVTTWISLPVENWNGRFLGMGGGGWVMGTLDALSQAVFGGYAAASTNGGHDELATVKSWGLASEGNVNLANMQDFSSVTLDEAASLGKAATKMFYGKPHKYAYWNGCSTGGRQGLMMAQRYPTQYDGILAGSPAINWDKFIPAEFWPQMLMNVLGKTTQ